MVEPAISLWRRAAAIVLLGAWLAPAAHAADITAQTDRANIGLEESFTLTFEAEGEVDGEPDFDPLTEDFDIISTRQSSSVNIINGQMSRRKTWTLELFPKREGDLTIPPIEFGDDRSPQLQIQVSRDAAADTGQADRADRDIFLKVEAEPENPYVQQQVRYTLRVYRGVPTHNARLDEPELSEADGVLRQLGDGNNYETVVNGRRYQVHERQYVILPQETGRLRVNPVDFNAVVSDGNRRNRFGFGGGKRVRQRSEAVELDVRSPPEAFTGRHWLPAESLQLSESWSPDPPEFKTGEPVTRTLTLTATGLTAAQLPELNIDLPAGIKQYPDQPALEDDADDGGVIGRRVEKTALIPTRPGRHTLPAVEVTWWNTKSGQMETARVPERTITVAAGPGGQSAPAQPGGQPSAEPDTGEQADPGDEPAAPAESDSEPESPPTTGAGFWPWLAALLGAAWLVTLGLWWHRETRRHNNTHRQQAAERAAHSARQALRRLEQACQNNDPESAKTALLDWGQALWPEAGIYNLSVLARRLDPAAAAEIQTLNDHLYRGGGDDWRGEALWRAVKECKVVSEGRVDEQGDGLAPLHKL